MTGPFNLQAFPDALEAVVVGLLGKGADEVAVIWGDADAGTRVPNHGVVLVLAQHSLSCRMGNEG